jgi:predicted metalloprotease
MKYNDQAQLDPSQMGGGGGRGGGKVALGGGAGLIVVVLALLFGINPGDILGGATTTADPSASSTEFANCQRGSDIEKNRDCRFVAYTNSIQDYWGNTVQGYQVIKVDSFTGSIDTACGNATSAVGPFYCPGDTSVYLDLGFFDELKRKFGAQGGDAAEAYVLAHEFGHHIQKLTGTMQKVQGGGSQDTGPRSGSVRLELQADCYAGVWFKHATDDPSSPVSEVTSKDLDLAVDAAAAVGDDRIQEKMQGQVTPETWTHGSAANRQKWLNRGFTTGDPNKCDTFASGAL